MEMEFTLVVMGYGRRRKKYGSTIEEMTKL